MAKNEDGEIELVLVNKQLIAVLFIVFVLMGIVFYLGYVVGRQTTPTVQAGIPSINTTAESPEPISISSPAAENPAQPEEIQAPVEAAAEPPARTAAQAPAPEPSKPEPPKAEPAKAAAPKAAPANAAKATGPQPSGRSAPIPGRTYLQLSATSGGEADKLVAQLRQLNYPAIAAPVGPADGLYRVLVGPMEDSALNSTKAALQAAGFKDAPEAFKRVF